MSSRAGSVLDEVLTPHRQYLRVAEVLFGGLATRKALVWGGVQIESHICLASILCRLLAKEGTGTPALLIKFRNSKR